MYAIVCTPVAHNIMGRNNHKIVIRRRGRVRAEVDERLALRRSVLNLYRKNEILVVTRKDTYESPMRRCNRCERTRKAFVVRKLHLFSTRPFPSKIFFPFLLLKKPRVLLRQVRSHSFLPLDEDRRPSRLDPGDGGGAKVVANELRVRGHVSSTLKFG